MKALSIMTWVDLFSRERLPLTQSLKTDTVLTLRSRAKKVRPTVDISAPIMFILPTCLKLGMRKKSRFLPVLGTNRSPMVSIITTISRVTTTIPAMCLRLPRRFPVYIKTFSVIMNIT